MQNDLWRFFFEYWDDNIIAPQSERVFVNARTVRVFEAIHGKSVVRKHLDFWVNEDSVRILGEADLLEPESRCVDLIGYVSELPLSDAPQDSSPSPSGPESQVLRWIPVGSSHKGPYRSVSTIRRAM